MTVIGNSWPAADGYEWEDDDCREGADEFSNVTHVIIWYIMASFIHAYVDVTTFFTIQNTILTHVVLMSMSQ